MFIIIGDKSRATARASDNLCVNCSNYLGRKYSLDDHEERLCVSVPSHPTRLRGPVSTCSDFYDKTKPSKSEMNKIAWIVEPSKRRVGFDAAVEIIPPSKRDDLRRED